VPPAIVPTAGGTCAAAQSLAHIVALPLVGRSVQTTGRYTVAAVALGLWVVPGCVVWMLWRPPPVQRAAEHDDEDARGATA
jgi:hypothetical protein